MSDALAGTSCQATIKESLRDEPSLHAKKLSFVPLAPFWGQKTSPTPVRIQSHITLSQPFEDQNDDEYEDDLGGFRPVRSDA
jgi:hypothetical protein